MTDVNKEAFEAFLSTLDELRRDFGPGFRIDTKGRVSWNDGITRDDGLTDAEGQVADALSEAWNAYAQLPEQHPSEPEDFADAIHICQQLLVMRIARRHYPKGWPVKA